MIAMIFASGQGLSVALNWSHSYFISFARSGWAGVWGTWLETFSPGRAWGLGLALGAVFASAAVLLRDARRNSLSALLIETKYPVRRREAPLVRLRRRMVALHPLIEDLVTLGTDLVTGSRVAMKLIDLFRHTLVVGTTGSGKTNTLRIVIEACLRAGWAVLFVCGKGDSDLARENCSLAQSLGVETYLFDANDPALSCAYNPLGHGDATSRANRIMAMSDYSEPHYQKLALGFAQVAFSVLEAANLRIDLLQIGQYLDTKSLLGALRRKGITDREHAQVLANRITEQRQNEPHITGLRADIRNLAQSSLSGLFDTRSKDRKVLELAKARTEGAYAHCVLPAMSYPNWSRQLGRLIIEDVKATAAVDKRPLFIVLDEAHSYAAENLTSLASMGRSFNLALVVATQD